MRQPRALFAACSISVQCSGRARTKGARRRLHLLRETCSVYIYTASCGADTRRFHTITVGSGRADVIVNSLLTEGKVADCLLKGHVHCPAHSWLYASRLIIELAGAACISERSARNNCGDAPGAGAFVITRRARLAARLSRGARLGSARGSSLARPFALLSPWCGLNSGGGERKDDHPIPKGVCECSSQSVAEARLSVVSISSPRTL